MKEEELSLRSRAILLSIILHNMHRTNETNEKKTK